MKINANIRSLIPTIAYGNITLEAGVILDTVEDKIFLNDHEVTKPEDIQKVASNLALEQIKMMKIELDSLPASTFTLNK